jgi:hypothetical protein
MIGPRLSLLASGLVATLLVVALFHFRHDPPSRLGMSSPPSLAPPLSLPTSSSLSPSAFHPTLLPLPERSDLADTLNAPDLDIHSDLRVVSLVLETFHSNFPQRGNPIGTNAEITATLTGKNALNLALIPRDHPAINARGELCDRWGHPFFFHQLSGTRTEIRSAGPDRKFWTDDDVILTP